MKECKSYHYVCKRCGAETVTIVTTAPQFKDFTPVCNFCLSSSIQVGEFRITASAEGKTIIEVGGEGGYFEESAVADVIRDFYTREF